MLRRKTVRLARSSASCSETSRFRRCACAARTSRPKARSARAYCARVASVHIVDLRKFGKRVLKAARSEEHTSELQSLMRISYAVFCLQKKHTSHNRDSKMQQQSKDSG